MVTPFDCKMARLPCIISWLKLEQPDTAVVATASQENALLAWPESQPINGGTVRVAEIQPGV